MEQHVWWSQEWYMVDWHEQVSDSPRGRLEKQAESSCALILIELLKNVEQGSDMSKSPFLKGHSSYCLEI